MSKFKELIKSLKAYTIVIIENEFTLIDDSLKILAFYCLSHENISNRIDEYLLKYNFTEIKDLLKKFKDNFEKLPHDEELINQIPAIDNFEHYLIKINSKKILDAFDLKLFEQIISADTDNFIRKIFLKFGAVNTYPNNQYDEIIQEIKEIKNSEILFFNQVPARTEFEDFINDIKNSLILTESNFYLCLIDKSLGSGDDATGKDFALNDLSNLNKENKLNSICFIYTSRPSQVDPPTELEHYYAQEIAKNSPPNFDEITQVLAQSAYATVFNNIHENIKESAKVSLSAVLKNQKNIKHIVNESHNEGIPPYDSVKYWYNLLTQKTFEQKETSDYSYVASLSSFFKNEFLNDHPNISEIDKEIRDLNNYEQFDDNVNIKHLPISPGDIFKIKNEYYILGGQLCDTLIRGKKLKRNYITGELLKIKISDEVLNGKYNIDTDGKVKKIKICNFNLEGVLKTLEIDISTTNTYLIELETLDLCCLNNDGNSKINIAQDINENILRLLPDYGNEYFKNIKDFFKEKNINKLRQILNNIQLYNPLLISKIDFSRKGKVIKYDIQRLSRLKGRYYDSLYNNILNNKGRIDLNLIDNSNETATSCKLIFSLPGGENLEILDFNLWSSRGRVFITKKDLVNEVNQYSELLSLCNDEELFGENKTQYNIKINGSIIELQYKYQLDEKKYHGKANFSYADFFKKLNADDDDTFTLLETNTTFGIRNDKGHPTRVFSIDELKKGICFHHEKMTIRLINGIIKREPNAE